MSRHTISLKSRIRYEGRAQIFDRRAKEDAALEKIPDPIWRTVGIVLRTRLREAAKGGASQPPLVPGKSST
jgi:hypothetical protein